MKKVSIVSLIALVAIIISSCGSSNSVVSNNGITKRKYNKGFFFNRKANLKTADAKVKEADLNEDKAIAKAEKVEARKAKKAQNANVLETTITSANIGNSSNHVIIMPVQEEEQVLETREFLSDDLADVEWTVVENQTSERGESVREMSSSERGTNNSNKKSDNNNAADSAGMTILLVILALIIPPLAVFLFEGVTSRFRIDLVLAIVGIGLGVGLGGLAYLAALAAIIYALLIVLNVI